MQAMDDTAIAARMDEIPGWTIEDGKLTRSYTFADFVAAFGFMTSVALEAEKAGHHPEWFNVYNRVRVQMTTHDAGGITDKDFALAARMNALAASADR